MEVLSALDPGKLRLYPDPLSMKLRNRIARIHGCDTSQIFVGNGSDEVLALCTRAFVENSGSIGYFNPSYSLYPVLAAIRDVEKRPVELGNDFEWPFDSASTSAKASADKQGRKMPDGYNCSLFFLTNPNAPTGILYPKAEVRGFCKVFSGVVVIDEAYVDFASENCMDLALELDNVLVLRTLSKSYSLAGLRVGYAVGSELLVNALLKIKDSYNVSALSQELALAALLDIEHMRDNVEKIKSTRKRLSKALIARGYTVYPSETNFLLVRPEGISAKELFEHLKKQRILIRYFPGEITGNFVRITIGTDDEIDKLIDAVVRL